MTWNNGKIDLADAVRDLAIDEDVVIENYDSPGMRIGGRWVPSASVTAGVTASVQPASGHEKLLLPEGMRSRDAITVFSTSELRPLDRSGGKPPSVIQWKGRRYSVEVLNDYYELGRYWEALCSSVEQ